MIFAAAAILGALLGLFRVKKLGGKGFDYLLYAVVFAIIFTLIALFVTLIAARG